VGTDVHIRIHVRTISCFGAEMITTEQIIEAARECANEIVFNLEGRKQVIDLDLEEELVTEIMDEISDEIKEAILQMYKRGLLDAAEKCDDLHGLSSHRLASADAFDCREAIRQMAE